MVEAVVEVVLATALGLALALDGALDETLVAEADVAAESPGLPCPHATAKGASEARASVGSWRTRESVTAWRLVRQPYGATEGG